jgi:single-stranded DNA-specific DHH superfamily exonuclease
MPPGKIAWNLNLKKINGLLIAGGRKILVFHRDSDGVCSAAVLLKFFADFETIPREGPIIDKEFFERIVSKKPGLLVFLDMPIDQEWKKVLSLCDELPDLRIIIIDHHIPEKNLNSARIIHINPMFSGPAYIPASCVVFELLRQMKYDVAPHRWISVIGVIGDYGMKDCAWLLREQKKYSDTPISEFFRMSDIISSSITFKGLKGAEKSLGLLVKSANYWDFEKSEELTEWNRIVQKEVRRIVADFEKNKSQSGKVILYEIKSKMNITSIIATITAEKYPKNIVIIRKKSGDHWKISLRHQDGSVSVGGLAKFASKGIGSGGGHVKSSGALVSDWEKFRDNVFIYLDSKAKK